MAREHLNMVNGNISSYCQVLNSEDQLEHLNEVTLITTSIAEVTKENETVRQRCRDKRKPEAAEKKKKDAENKKTAEHKSIENNPKCDDLKEEIKDKGHDHVKKLVVCQLMMLLQYEFDLTAVNGNQKDECAAAAMMYIDARDSLKEVQMHVYKVIKAPVNDLVYEHVLYYRVISM
jgi:hypothetical protein